MYIINDNIMMLVSLAVISILLVISCCVSMQLANAPGSNMKQTTKKGIQQVNECTAGAECANHALTCTPNSICILDLMASPTDIVRTSPDLTQRVN